MSYLSAPTSRWVAAGLHVLLSIVVVGTIAVTVILMWFPAGLWHVAGLQRLFAIMIGADVVLGPLLTLLVYRRGKRGLRFDLAMIGMAQAAFLAYGVHTLWLNRPLFLVGSAQAFALVFASELPDDAVAQANAKQWPRFRRHGPWLVGVDLSSPVARDEYLFAFAMGSGGPLRDPDLYVPYQNVVPAILTQARMPSSRIDIGDRARSSVRSRALLSIRATPSALLLDARTGQPLVVAN